jgi:pteridine reductase
MSAVVSSSARPVALITGAARRIGRAIAITLARAGCDLVLSVRTSNDGARTLDRDLLALGARTRWIELDLDDLDTVDRRVTSLARELPRLDVLVHNASAYDPVPLASLDPEGILGAYRVNAAAPLLLSARLAPRLAESPLPGGGAIVAMGDMHALGRPRRNFSAYLMSKAALHQMVRSLALELAPRVRVNAIAPGVVAFPEAGREADEDFRLEYVRRVPLARAGTPEDAAGAVRWLALDAPYITGEVIRLDGGRWLA